MFKPHHLIAGILVCSLIQLFLGGCGYRFSGGGTLPEGVRKVYIRVLENRTGEVGIENTITNDIMDAFTRNNKDILAGSLAAADAVLSGAVAAVSTSNASRTAGQNAVQRRVTVRVQLTLRSAEGRVLWAADNISAAETYDVDDESASTAIARGDAIISLSKRLAEDVYEKMTVDF